MRSRALRWTFAVCVCGAALAPGLGDAFEWNGSLGLIYSRNDTWATGAQLTTPRLDLSAALDANGYVVSPGVFSFKLGTDYRRMATANPGERESVSDVLNYKLQTGVFMRPGTPLGLNLQATQSRQDVASGTSGVPNAGTLVRLYGANLRSDGLLNPSLSAGYTRLESTRHYPGVPDDDRTLDTVTADVTHGGTNFSYSARYRGQNSDGTTPVDDYADHQVDVDAAGRVSRDTQLRISDRYTRREPKSTSGFNPRQELNSMTASLELRPTSSDFQVAGYHYTRALQSADGTPDTERTLHRVSYLVQRELEERTWQLRGTVDATASIDRLGDGERRSMGETLGAVATWRPIRDRDRSLELRAGPTVGVLEPDGSDTAFGYGGTAGGTWSRTRQVLVLRLSYDATYANELGVEGWSFRQQGIGTAEGPLGGGTVRGQLTLSGERRESPSFGVGGSRNAAVSCGYSWQRYNVTGALGYSAGLANRVADPGLGDGLFLALPYDTHALNGSLAAGARLTTYLRFSASARITSAVFPGRPGRDERELQSKLEYNIGALRIGLEDRYLSIGSSGGSFRYNEVMVTANRVFGSR